MSYERGAGWREVGCVGVREVIINHRGTEKELFYFSLSIISLPLNTFKIVIIFIAMGISPVCMSVCPPCEYLVSLEALKALDSLELD